MNRPKISRSLLTRVASNLTRIRAGIRHVIEGHRTVDIDDWTDREVRHQHRQPLGYERTRVGHRCGVRARRLSDKTHAMRIERAHIIAAGVIAAVLLSFVLRAQRRDDDWTPVDDLSPSDQRALAEAMLREMRGSGELEPVDLASAPSDLDTIEDPTAWLLESFARCGTVDLGAFAGAWRAPDAVDDTWARTVIHDGRVESGATRRQELCPVHVLERGEASLLALATWHEDVHDPGDASLTYLRLTRRGDALTVCSRNDRAALDAPYACVELRRIAY